MNYLLEYEEFGEINRTAPLEAFYETMFPQLKNYGVTAEFPADKPSLAEGINGIEHDVFVGDAPNAVRYLKWQGSPYANGGFELTLESETLVHKETGNKLAFKIFISDYIRGMKHESENFSLILKFRGEQREVESLRKSISPVLEKYNFQSHEVKKAQIISDNLEEKSNKNSNSELMTKNVNFDELAQKAFAPTAVSTDFENLFAAVFSLDAWYFIADEAFEYKMPYCAIFPDYFGEEIALTVFTDRERARKYIAEKEIKFGASAENPNAPNAPEDLILRISTTGILDFFDRLAPLKITKIFFNPNKDSEGFHHDLKMMRPIYDHLENKGLLAKPSAENDSNNLEKLIEENADVIADFERENEIFSSMIAGSAAAMEDVSEEGREQIISNTAEMFESVRVQQNMSPKLFRAYIETCLDKQKFLMPALAFAYLQQSESGIKKLQNDRELADDLAKFFIKKAVPNADLLMDEKPQDRTAAEQKDVSSAVENGVDFDALSKKAMETNAMEDLNALFGAAFALEKWHFISRGELPNVYPYVASNPTVADNQPMIRAFTDADRLMRFARENNLTDADGSANILTIPTENIIPYLEGFTSQGAFGVWFNCDSESKDFYIPIRQLQPIKDHLAKLKPTTAEAKFTTLLITITDGLSLPSGLVKQSSYNCNFFCWIPREWTEDLQLKTEYLEKLYEQFYGAGWRAGNSDGSRYVVIEANSAVISPERVESTKWNVVQNNELNRYWFYIGEANGTFKSVTADEFQANFDAYFQTKNTNEARKRQDNLADLGFRESPDGGIEQNLVIGDSPVSISKNPVIAQKIKDTVDTDITINKVGAVNFDTSIAPFYEAIVPLLQDFQGTGEYLTLLRFEESGKSGQVENIAENSHGAYLQIRRFLYLNPKNNVRIGVNSIHSKTLRHVETNAELILSFELCKNLDNQTGVFYHAFQGPKSEVLKLSEAIQPILEANGYQAVQ